jgi:hypothetical protein
LAFAGFEKTDEEVEANLFPPAPSTADKPASMFPNGRPGSVSTGPSPFTAPSPEYRRGFLRSRRLRRRSAGIEQRRLRRCGYRRSLRTAPSPFSFSKPSEPTQKTETPETVAAAPSTLFKPSSPASLAESKNPFGAVNAPAPEENTDAGFSAVGASGGEVLGLNSVDYTVQAVISCIVG